ncbi:hypothetical protein F4777DRAFT_447252 [Nemania sp. FL0916]|nr:hypothetical protein F4777DRAFT_447252 [Nemania sp. FL0916]
MPSTDFSNNDHDRDHDSHRDALGNRDSEAFAGSRAVGPSNNEQRLLGRDDPPPYEPPADGVVFIRGQAFQRPAHPLQPDPQQHQALLQHQARLQLQQQRLQQFQQQQQQLQQMQQRQALLYQPAPNRNEAARLHQPALNRIEPSLEPPLSEEEIISTSVAICEHLSPWDMYHKETEREDRRFEGHGTGPRPVLFRGERGSRRKGVIIRHNVRRLWEKLGLWNPRWGFAGRRLDASDDFRKWTWRWQPDGARDDEELVHRDDCELVARALRLRHNLQRGEYVPAMPRSYLAPDATAAEAEVFLTSRPWFQFILEIEEERTRNFRFSVGDLDQVAEGPRRQVIKWWKARGIYKSAESWMWPHESPSPEPEDLSPISSMRNSPLDAMEAMQFSPEEIQELENIELPSSQHSRDYWAIERGDMPPYFPGQLRQPPYNVPRPFRTDGYNSDEELIAGLDLDALFPDTMSDFPGAVQGEAAAGEHEAPRDVVEGSPELQQVAAGPPQKRRRLHHRQPQDDVPEPQPRRSSRIAGMKRSAEPLPHEAAPNKKTRRTAAPKVAAPTAAAAVAPNPSRKTRSAKPKAVAARASPKDDDAPPKRRPGRPRKDDRPSAPPTKEKKKSVRASAKALVRTGKAAETSAPDVPKRRGRPRKENGPIARPAKDQEQKKPVRASAKAKAKTSKAAETSASNVPRRRGRPRKNA